MAPARSTSFPDGTTVPVLGQGTWRLGEDPARAAEEAAALRAGVNLGLTLRIPKEAGHLFRDDVVHRSDVKPATVPR